ncbi:MAG: molybdopterin-dependent oxidoreductase [Acidobacteriaceae bacterium]
MPSHVVHAACPHDCPDSCGVLITVDDLGKATKIQGDPGHPVTRGFLCAKVAKYLSRVYSPDRVLYPLKRKSGVPKGVAGVASFERITWDEALDTIATGFRQVAEEFGPEAILPYSYAGNMGVLGYGSMDRRFFHRLGASQLDRTICSTAGGEALISVYGRKFGTDPEAFADAKYIIVWGANIHGNNVHLWPFIEEARRKGAKLVVIDPYRTRTAKCADWYLPINPGTDVALAMSLMHVIITEELIDADYIARAADGYPELKAIVTSPDYAPQRVSGIIGIAAEDIRRLAREYATTKPAAIRANYGLQRTDNGGTAIRAVAMLPVITGQWRHYGGGLQLSTSGAFGLNQQKLTRPDLMYKALGREARTINMAQLGSALTELDGPPVKAIFVYNSNPAAIAPDQANVLRGLRRDDLFTVVHEQFMTDTTDYADIVLPATTFFEHNDLQSAYGHYYLQISEAAIAPLGEARDNIGVFRDLAAKMGFQRQNEDASLRESHEQMIEGALDSDDPHLHGITRQRLQQEHRIRLNMNGGPQEGNKISPFADGHFPTPGGKAMLKNPDLEKIGVHPVLAYHPNPESRQTPVAAYPLEMLARKADHYLNSTFANLETLRPLEMNHLLEMHEADANPRGIVDGDPVRVYNQRGSVALNAKVYPAAETRVQPGVVASRLNWNKLSPDGKGLNQLTAERLTDIGRGPVFYSCLVEVEKDIP